MPRWMQVQSTNRRMNTTFISLQNESKLLTFTVSGNKKATDVARGLSTYTISIDESAFIRDFEEMYMSLAPAYSTASTSARQYGLVPSMVLTTTPNGTVNPFYDFWTDAINLEDIYDFELGRLKDDWRDVINLSTNGFVRVMYHWSDVYDLEWYNEQKKLLNNNRASILQELDCRFLGNSNSIFDTETIERLKLDSKLYTIKLSYGASIDFYAKPRSDEMYVMGVDTAGTSTDTSDNSALVILDIESKQTIAELKWKNGIIRRFTEVIREVTEHMLNILDDDYSRFYLAIENNSYGKNVIEQLLYEDSDYDHPYDDMIIKTSKSKPIEEVENEILPMKKKKKDVREKLIWDDGINTNIKTRPQMINMIINAVNETPHTITMEHLMSEIGTLIATRTGKIEASRGAKDDMVMAFGLALYGIKQLMVQNRIYIEDSKDSRYKEESALKSLEEAINSVFVDEDDRQIVSHTPESNEDDFFDLVFNPMT